MMSFDHSYDAGFFQAENIDSHAKKHCLPSIKNVVYENPDSHLSENSSDHVLCNNRKLYTRTSPITPLFSDFSKPWPLLSRLRQTDSDYKSKPFHYPTSRASDNQSQNQLKTGRLTSLNDSYLHDSNDQLSKQDGFCLNNSAPLERKMDNFLNSEAFSQERDFIPAINGENFHDRNLNAHRSEFGQPGLQQRDNVYLNPDLRQPSEYEFAPENHYYHEVSKNDPQMNRWCQSVDNVADQQSHLDYHDPTAYHNNRCFGAPPRNMVPVSYAPQYQRQYVPIARNDNWGMPVRPMYPNSMYNEGYSMHPQMVPYQNHLVQPYEYGMNCYQRPMNYAHGAMDHMYAPGPYYPQQTEISQSEINEKNEPIISKKKPKELSRSHQMKVCIKRPTKNQILNHELSDVETSSLNEEYKAKEHKIPSPQNYKSYKKSQYHRQHVLSPPLTVGSELKISDEEHARDDTADLERELAEALSPVVRRVQKVERIRLCINCGTDSSSTWRLSKDRQMLCNACGLYAKLHSKMRPSNLFSNSNSKRKRVRRGLMKSHMSESYDH